MSQQPRHRPERRFPDAPRRIVECELEHCVHCGAPLVPSGTWHVRKRVQTLDGPLFVAGKSKQCENAECAHAGQHYHASGVLRISLPHSTYGLAVLAFIGWQHEHEHRQLVEIQRQLQARGLLVCERNVGRLYRQFLALLGGLTAEMERRLAETAADHGGLIWGIDALQPDGHGSLLYVLYEVLSGTAVAGIQLDHATTAELVEWLRPYQALPHQVLATLSDGEEAIMAALEQCWPDAPRQRCQEHFLGNLAEPVLAVDARLRQQMRDDLGGLPAVPEVALSQSAGAPGGAVPEVALSQSAGAPGGAVPEVVLSQSVGAPGGAVPEVVLSQSVGAPGGAVPEVALSQAAGASGGAAPAAPPLFRRRPSRAMAS